MGLAASKPNPQVLSHVLSVYPQLVPAGDLYSMMLTAEDGHTFEIHLNLNSPFPQAPPKVQVVMFRGRTHELMDKKGVLSVAYWSGDYIDSLGRLFNYLSVHPPRLKEQMGIKFEEELGVQP